MVATAALPIASCLGITLLYLVIRPTVPIPAYSFGRWYFGIAFGLGVALWVAAGTSVMLFPSSWPLFLIVFFAIPVAPVGLAAIMMSAGSHHEHHEAEGPPRV